MFTFGLSNQEIMTCLPSLVNFLDSHPVCAGILGLAVGAIVASIMLFVLNKIFYK